MSGQGLKTALAAAVAVFLFLLDRLLKYLALHGEDSYFELLPQVLSFNLARNHYIAFSLPIGGPLLVYFNIILLGALLIFCFLAFRQKRQYLAFFIGLAALGAASNIIDRLVYGYVIDYFDLSYFTVFNVADMLIVAGGLVIFLELSFSRPLALMADKPAGAGPGQPELK